MLTAEDLPDIPDDQPDDPPDDPPDEPPDNPSDDPPDEPPDPGDPIRNIITAEGDQAETLLATEDADLFVFTEISDSTRNATDEIVGLAVDDAIDLRTLGFETIGDSGRPGDGHLLIREIGAGKAWQHTKVLGGWGGDDFALDIDDVVGIDPSLFLLGD